MRMKNFVKGLVDGFYKPSINATDLIMLFLILLLFNNLFIKLLLFFVWYIVSAKVLVPNLGFEVVKNDK